MAETVLVTGGTGYVGGWAIVALLERGYDVRTTVRAASKEQAVRDAVGSGWDSRLRIWRRMTGGMRR
ncbi:NAD-dependent epimerase/dehydratase family protein [Kribbella pittospori]|uniref:NAD-dependent epimerase/dehydratase family protein n=1 Tax=Kribbella pittospori TaxID=722689 RepID=UPI00192DAA5F|nr:NAD-dependent epimerase/dehydratase family protein [Kribbella pittospori]